MRGLQVQWEALQRRRWGVTEEATHAYTCAGTLAHVPTLRWWQKNNKKYAAADGTCTIAHGPHCVGFLNRQRLGSQAPDFPYDSWNLCWPPRLLLSHLFTKPCVCAGVCVCVFQSTCSKACMWLSKADYWELVLSCCHLVSEDQTKIVRVDSTLTHWTTLPSILLMGQGLMVAPPWLSTDPAYSMCSISVQMVVEQMWREATLSHTVGFHPVTSAAAIKN